MLWDRFTLGNNLLAIIVGMHLTFYYVKAIY